jgi:hypothetical protein
MPPSPPTTSHVDVEHRVADADPYRFAPLERVGESSRAREGLCQFPQGRKVSREQAPQGVVNERDRPIANAHHADRQAVQDAHLGRELLLATAARRLGRSVGLMRTVTEPRPAASQLGSQDAM